MSIIIEGISIRLDYDKNELTIFVSKEPITIDITSEDTKSIAIGMAAHIIKPTIPRVKRKYTKRQPKPDGFVPKVRRPAPEVSGPELIKQRGEAILAFVKKAKKGVSMTEINKTINVGPTGSGPAMRHLLSTKQIFRSQSAPCYTRYGITQKLAQEASDSLRLSR
jgi:hypothetical protein